MPEILEATFRIVTPMFIGGADQTPADGIRPPSVKGALRFWWRALNWGRFRAEASCDEHALQLMHGEEVRLFGGAAEQGGQGCFLLSVSQGAPNTTAKGTLHPSLARYAAARYLGYGLMVAYGSKDKRTKDGQLERPCINEAQEFFVRLVFRNGVDVSVQDALIAWGLLGSLGSRARHGYGCVALSSIKKADDITWAAPTDDHGYMAQVKKLLDSYPVPVPPPGTAPAFPPYTAFSGHARVVCLSLESSPYKVLEDFGEAMLGYRSWGQTSKANALPGGQVSEKRFRDDHDWSKECLAKTMPNFHPRRVMFGLPHNYGKPDSLKVNAEHHERRSSPLLFHVHRVGNSFVGVAIYLPATFLPNGERINAGGKKVPAVVDDWSVITDFLDKNKGNPPGTQPRFPARKAVFP